MRDGVVEIPCQKQIEENRKEQFPEKESRSGNLN